MPGCSSVKQLAIIGGGPAGLMAAEAAVAAGCAIGIDLFDAMPSAGRKFLMAGKSGLNLTHGEPLDRLLARFGSYRDRLEPMIAAFGPDAIRAWAGSLGVETFIGSSGQVFPVDFKAAPLLRAWIRRLKSAGVRFNMRHRWTGWDDAGRLLFATPMGMVTAASDATILALGGASWPLLGSDGAWVPLLEDRGAAVVPLRPADCGFDAGWSAHFRDRFAGQPVKTVGIASGAGTTRGEIMITATGVEGGGIYPHSAALRDRIAAEGTAMLILDLLPDRPAEALAAALARPRGSRSLAEHLRRTAGLDGVKAGLLRECRGKDIPADPRRLARAIKSLELNLVAPRPIAEAISSAGGVAWDGITEDLMLRRLPGVFVAGEMLDWEVSTGGYLLTACLATGLHAGKAAAAWLCHTNPR